MKKRPARSPQSVATEPTPGNEMDTGLMQRGDGMLPIVGLGGSAGGIVAMQEFFAAMPVDSGMAFVVILHLSPTHESSLPEMFQRSTAMPVVAAIDGAAVEPNVVYVIPPGKFLAATNGQLRLTEAEEHRGRRVAVDYFFRTLAETHGAQSVAVVLSGAGRDGALGLKRVKELGGLTIAQDPDQAEHPDMPRSAIATGMVDWVLGVKEMPAKLLAYVKQCGELKLPGEDGPHPAAAVPLSPDEHEVALRDVLAFLHTRTGRDFSCYKRATILRRISRRMRVNGLAALPGYLVYLRTHAGEAGALLQDLLISVTNFFRDPASFAALERTIPEMFKGKAAGDTVRVWVAGCATGEEAYSIAMLLSEHARTLVGPPQLQVFATDLDKEVIREAREGLYPETIAADVSEERLQHFFIHEQGGYRVRRAVRELVLFAPHDLLKDSPFSRLDLVSCRNLLIYLNREAQSRAFDIFHFALRPGGRLFLGTSEAVDEGSPLFAVFDKKQRLYVHRPGPQRLIAVPSGPGTLARALALQERARERPTFPPRVSVDRIQASLDQPVPYDSEVPPGELHYRLIERFSPPSILVNSAHEIVHLSESAGRFLQFTGGEPTRNLLRTVHPMLRVELRTALYAAAGTHAAATALRVPVETGEARSVVDIRVTPAGDLAPNFLLVVFEEHPGDEAAAVIATRIADTDQAAMHLERELVATKAHLRETIEESETSTQELKASNEELQAMNEELRSATEELETSREELQSINEELTTVNDELKSNVDQLARSNNDLQNLMAATDIATVFLDRELRIQRFTPSAKALFNFISTDLGRPLSDLNRQLDYPEIVADAERSLASLQPAQRDVCAGEHWYLARSLPYRTADDHIAGVVLTFTDITTIKNGEDATARLAAIVEYSNDAIVGNDLRGTLTSWNFGAEKIFGYTSAEMIGQPLARLIPQERRFEEAEILSSITAGETITSFETIRVRKDGTTVPISATISPIRDAAGKIIGGSTIARDISETKLAEAALRQSEERLAFVRRSSGVGFWYCDLPFDVLEWDALVKAQFHLPPDAAVTIQTFYDRIHPDDREPTRLAIERSIADRTPYNTVYRTVNPETGAVLWIRAIGRTFYAADGIPSRFDGVTLDVSEQKRAEQDIVRLAAESDRQRRLYETVLMNTPDFMYVFSLDHKVLYANEALIQMWGRGYDGAIGKTFLEIGYEPWHAEMHGREIDQVRATRQPVRGEVPFNGTNGRRMYDYIFVPVIGADGEVEAVAGTTRDVTERKAAEERQEFLVALGDSIRALSDPIAVQATASRMLGKQLAANRVAYFEVEGDDFVVERDYTDAVPSNVGRYPVAAFGPELLATYQAGRTATEADTDSLSSLTQEQKEAFAALQIRSFVGVPLIKDGRFLAGLAVHAADVRTWKAAEIAMAEETAERTWEAVQRARAGQEVTRLAAEAERERQLFDTTLSNTTDFNFIFSPDGRIVYANRSLLALWGRTADEARGKSLAEVGYPPDVEAQLLGNIRRVVETGHFVRDETSYAGPHVETPCYEYAFAPVLDAAGKVIQIVGSARDIRERKRIEDRLRRLATELRDADRRKDEFLATLAHELRNPLAPIRNGLQVMRLAGASGTIEQARSMMERQLTQLVRLVDDLLDVSRVTSGKMELRRERVEIKAVVEAAVETSRPAIDQGGHELKIVLPGEPIFVDGDPARLAQVVSNLLNNSAKYTQSGGHIRLTVCCEDGIAVVSVADDGIGIPPTMLDKVFEMFTQIDRALERTTGGLGIGLSLVAGLIQMHGGSIEAFSEGEGRGSEFVVRLPVVLSTSQKVPEQRADEKIGSPRRQRILIADDNVDSADSLGEFLRLVGHEVSITYDGLQAVALAETFRPDVVLLDIGMPKLNGYDAARRIRAQAAGQDIALVALTGWGQVDDRKKSSNAGFDHHLVKPVQIPMLMGLLAGLSDPATK